MFETTPLNRKNKRIEKSMGLAIDATIPSSRAVPIAMNQGLAVIEDDSRSPAAKAVEHLLTKVAPSHDPSPSGRSWLQRVRAGA